jgi:hypothetical protein
MELTITPEIEALVQNEMSHGRFSDPGELIVAALTAFSETTPLDLDNLDSLLQEGIDSADRGEWYTEEEARAYLAALRAKV